MKTLLKRAMVLGAIAAAMGTGVANAEVMEVTVPFQFEVQGQMLPAGKYRVDYNPQHPSVVLVRSISGDESLFVLTAPALDINRTGESPAFTFTMTNGTYRLATIWGSPLDGRQILAE